MRKAARDAQRIVAQKEYARIKKLLDSINSQRMLDIGSGVDATASCWAQRGWETFGIDYDQDVVREAVSLVAAERAPTGQAASAGQAVSAGQATASVHLLVSEAERLPFAADSFAVCLCYSLLEHVPAYRTVLSEAIRVLRPGGVLRLTTTNRFHPRTTEVKYIPFYPWFPEAIKAAC